MSETINRDQAPRSMTRDHVQWAGRVMSALVIVVLLAGGAICAHIRMGELGTPPELASLFLGAMTWGGLYARYPRIRAVLPLIHQRKN